MRYVDRRYRPYGIHAPVQFPAVDFDGGSGGGVGGGGAAAAAAAVCSLSLSPGL